jgi:CRP/FNR family cyclic AMP-dependent transcriptional regulator
MAARVAGGILALAPSEPAGTLVAESRERLLAVGVAKKYPAGRVLMRMGDKLTFVIVLLEGIVKATSLTPDGKEVLLAIRAGGPRRGVRGAGQSATVQHRDDVRPGCGVPDPAA